jgi:hypothetical protein
MSLLESYRQKEEKYEQSAIQWQRKFNAFSWLRVGVFVAVGGSGWLAYQLLGVGAALLVAAAGLVVFATVVRRHAQIAYTRNQFRFLAAINREEQARFRNEHHPDDDGRDFANPVHPYTGDLDVFGRSSLYVLLNRTNTLDGRRQLASWLRGAATVEEIRGRQRAVAELAPALDWRQAFQATGRHLDSDPETLHRLLAWLGEPPAVSGRKWLVLLAYLMPVLTVAAIGLAVFTEAVTYHLPVLFLLVNGWLLRYSFAAVHRAAEGAYQTSRTLRAYGKLISTLEEHSFATEKMHTVKVQLSREGVTASGKIHQLAGLLTNLQARNNAIFYLLANPLLLWDLFWLIRLEQWKAGMESTVRQWFAALGEAEALNSLAGFAYANPGYTLPEITTHALQYEARQLGHPLILASKRVSNDFSMAGLGKTLVVTGSNMSGKSTFLRTLGINAVLALAGAPVCATACCISIFRVFTAMRTQDSLEESVSSFYAELKRLRQLIELLPDEQPVFYLLDEILKGTNSHDRHEGAKALIRQLHKHHASGLVSTHDLALGQLGEVSPEYVENYSFNSDLADGKLHFDYKLREGICRSFNASQLMRQMGIEM